MNLRQIISWLHLYLGLASGLIVFIVAITGCIYVFQRDIYEFVNHDKVFIQHVENHKQVPLIELKKTAESAIKGKKITFITTYTEPNRTWEFVSYKSSNPDAFFYFDTIDYYLSILINPYTGHIVSISDKKYDFFTIIKFIHWNLLINHPIGRQVVGASTLTFIILLVTGVILWLPRKLKWQSFKQRLTIKYKAKFKRLNHDLHNVLGFYSLVISLIIALTGIVWTYPWMKTVVNFVTVEKTRPHVMRYISHNGNNLPINNALKTISAYTQTQLTRVKRLNYNLANTITGVIYVSTYPCNDCYYGSDDLIFDQYSGELLNTKSHNDKNRAEKLLDANYDVHTGAILGFTGKIIAVIISLIIASLPITGFIFWLGKKKD